MMRRELGIVARVFIGRRLYRRLGFVRLSDYARERLGVSGRSLQVAAWLSTRLDALPAVSRAYDRSELSWTQARALCAVASPADEEQWLEIACRRTVDELERLVRQARAGSNVPADPEPEDATIDGEPAIRWRFACPARVRAIWRLAVEWASRVDGRPLSTWQAAEVIAAEGSSGRPNGPSPDDRALIEAIRLARRTQRAGDAEKMPAPVEAPVPADGVCTPGELATDDPASFAAEPARADAASLPSELAPADAVPLPAAPAPAETVSIVADPAPAEAAPSSGEDTPPDAFALDARLDDAMRAIRTAEPRIGRLLRIVVDHRLSRMLGFATLDDYARERLGLSLRKVWALAKVERATARSDEFARAYRDGRLSWVQALTLLPVLDRATADAWVMRADGVTVRRLADEVNWVLEARDVSGDAVSLIPPPLDSRLTSPAAPLVARCRESSRRAGGAECRESSPGAGVQIGACPAPLVHERFAARSEIIDAEIAFFAPVSVIALLRDVLDAFGEAGTPRWRALERLLHHVVHHWESMPRHPDPIFARDGWRCTVPGCSSRRNLHDHHIQFRSRGGLNTRDNRTAVCAAHHLHGLHDGTIRASGSAPSAIEWQLGVRSGGPPFATYVGDRRCEAAYRKAG